MIFETINKQKLIIMNTHETKLSPIRIKRLKEQGYGSFEDQTISELAYGIRFPYRLCAIVLFIGVSTANIPILLIMMVIAFFGVVLPNHPFDYIYNYMLRKYMNKPKLPPRSNQLKFACLMATPWIGATIYLFLNEYMVAGYVLGSLLIGTASLVGTTDRCMPSKIYNYFLSKRIKATL
jgi:hypothetical protein